MKPETKYLVFAVEYYRNSKNLTGKQVAELFSSYNIYQFILDNYFLFHIESPEHMVLEVDEIVAKGEKYGNIT